MCMLAASSGSPPLCSTFSSIHTQSHKCTYNFITDEWAMSAKKQTRIWSCPQVCKSASQHIHTYSRHLNLYCSHRILACTYILIQKMMIRISFPLTQSAMDMFSVALLNRKTLKHTHTHTQTHTRVHKYLPQFFAQSFQH